MRRLKLARWSRLRAAVALAICGFLLLGWQGVSTVARNGAVDAGEHLAYAQYLDEHGHLPADSLNYEYATPPLFHVLAIGAERVARHVPALRVELPWNAATRGLWLLLVGGGAAAMTSVRRPRRTAGAAGLALGAVWALDEALSLARSQPWSAGRLIALACGTGLVLVTGLIARQIWPAHPRRAIAAGAFAAAYPVVYRMSILFHPEVLFALLWALALLALLRAARLGWPARLGWWLGAACGAAALTRQPAVLVIACLGAVGLLAGGRSARGFLVRAGVVAAVLAVPWWAYAYHRWHNPVQSNLAPRASLMMDRQPRSFFVSFPFPALVTHPYRPRFDDELLPKLHAELWSDWFGAIHPWQAPSRVDRVTASTQSLLGFVGDALAIGGLAALAIPAALRLLGRRARAPSDFGLGLLAVVAAAAFVAFVITLIRFPQRYGDPIKSSYLLFTTPCWAAFSVAAWDAARRRLPRLGALLAAVAVLYAASYAADLEGALAHTTGPRILGGAAGFTDLNAAIQQTSPTPGLGGEIDFLAGVENTGNQGAGGVVLTVKLPAGMKLLGPPAYEQGRGCTGTSTITCRLDGVPGGGATRIRFGVLVTRSGPQTMTASVASESADVNPADDSTSFTVDL